MRFIAIVLIISILGGCAEEKESDESLVRTPIFIIIGQSNAASRGYYEDYEPNDNLKILNDKSNWVYSDPSLNKYSNVEDMRLYQGYSFGYSFAVEYGGKIKIISNARSGSTVYSQETWIFNAAWERIEPFKKQITAILYHQGESDADEEDEVWVDSIVRIVNKYREAIGRDVPFIFGELNHSDLTVYFNDHIYDLLLQLDNVGIVSSEGLGLEYGGHFSSNGQIEFGKRYFAKYQELADSTVQN